jgi:hypothetical protein
VAFLSKKILRGFYEETIPTREFLSEKKTRNNAQLGMQSCLENVKKNRKRKEKRKKGMHFFIPSIRARVRVGSLCEREL